MKLTRLGGSLKKFAGIGLLIVVWQALATSDVVNPFLLPPPSRLVSTFWDMLIDGSLLVHAASSLERVVVGFAIAAVVGTVLGVALGWWPAISEQLMPVVEAVRPIPPIAWTPLAILWFGIGNAPSYFLVFIGAVFPVFVATYSAVRNIERTQINAALCLGATPA